jgi:hypothetical protein
MLSWPRRLHSGLRDEFVLQIDNPLEYPIRRTSIFVDLVEHKCEQ